MDRRRMMELIAQMESSGGKHREHPTVTQGVQAGTRSVSSYGLMPNTVYELAKRDKNFAESPIGQQVVGSNGDPEVLNKITEDPQNDTAAMDALMADQERRLAPHIQDPEEMEPAMVYAHRRGVSGAIKAMQDKQYLNDPYVKDYMNKKANSPRIDGEDPRDEAMLGALNSLANK